MGRSPFNTPLPPSAAPLYPASDKAKDYLRDLMLDKAFAQGHKVEEAVVNINAWLEKNPHRHVVSENIDRLKGEGYTGWAHKDAAKKSEPPVELEDGFYELPDGRIIKVRHIIYGPGEGVQYGKVFVPKDQREDDVKWAKCPGILKLTAAEGKRIDTDESRATELGLLYGVCMCCGADLTDDSPGGSIERGIGPVCLSKRGW